MGHAIKTATTTSFNAFFGWVISRPAVAKQRRDLNALGFSLLDDLGISDAQARREAHKPFWA